MRGRVGSIEKTPLFSSCIPLGSSAWLLCICRLLRRDMLPCLAHRTLSHCGLALLRHPIVSGPTEIISAIAALLLFRLRRCRLIARHDRVKQLTDGPKGVDTARARPEAAAGANRTGPMPSASSTVVIDSGIGWMSKFR